MAKNFEKIADDARVWAEIGEIHKSGRTRPCAFLSQYSMENMVASATVEIEGDKIKLVGTPNPPLNAVLQRG